MGDRAASITGTRSAAPRMVHRKQGDSTPNFQRIQGVRVGFRWDFLR